MLLPIERCFSMQNGLGAVIASSVVQTGILVGLLILRPTDQNKAVRLQLLVAFAFFTGLNMGPQLDYIISVDVRWIIVLVLIWCNKLFWGVILNALGIFNALFNLLGIFCGLQKRYAAKHIKWQIYKYRNIGFNSLFGI